MMVDRGNDRGHAAVELMLVVALLLVPVTVALATIPTWAEHQAAARDAATGAARVAVARADTSAVASRVAGAESDWGLDPGALSWTVDGAAADRGGALTVTVVVEIPALDLPGWGPVGAVAWSASHTEPVPRHRSRS